MAGNVDGNTLGRALDDLPEDCLTSVFFPTAFNGPLEGRPVGAGHTRTAGAPSHPS